MTIDYLQEGQQFMQNPTLPCVEINKALKEKWYRKLWNGVLFLQDNAPALNVGKIMDFLKNLGLECIDHPTYSQDLTAFPVFKP